VAQKRRTRQALLEAGLRVLERGEEPSLETVAAEADVSRATAYRYFPRIESLLSVLPLARLVDDPQTILSHAPPDDPVAAALSVQSYFFDLVVDNEIAFRRLITAVLEEFLKEEPTGEYEPLRGSYRLRTLDAAVASLENEVDDSTLEHLRVSLVALSGIEALMVVKDVCGLDPASGREALEWATRALVEAARKQGTARSGWSHPPMARTASAASFESPSALQLAPAHRACRHARVDREEDRSHREATDIVFDLHHEGVHTVLEAARGSAESIGLPVDGPPGIVGISHVHDIPPVAIPGDRRGPRVRAPAETQGLVRCDGGGLRAASIEGPRT
jgi:AcrR family transcriptional regulator